MTRGTIKYYINGKWVPIHEGDNWEPPTPSNDKKLWRYRTLEQYVSLLDRQELWFSRSDQFDDPYEGSIPYPNVTDREDKFDTSNAIKKASDSRFLLRYMTYLNCWHMNEHESNAMWKEYGRGRGVAIISTPRKIKESFSSLDEFEFGEVSYKDYSSESIPADSTISPFYHKKNAFSHEKEYRILHRDFDDFPEDGVPQKELHSYQDQGKQVNVDLETLVDKVIISPTAPDWIAETVKSVTEKYEYDFSVVDSGKEERPRF